MSEARWSIDDVPVKPGVYLFRDRDGRVLYVGKAADLQARLRSYRRPGGDGRPLIRFLVEQAERVETIVTRTEQEALLLEDSLIKKEKPPHNVRLKDDKSFLMLRLDLAERFPRIKLVRAHSPKTEKQRGRSRYFGPFASTSALRRTLSDLHRVVPLRDCPDSVFEHRTRPCLKHQLGLCAAPCVGLISEGDYRVLLDRASRALSGDVRELQEELESRMRAAAAELAYERAAVWRDRLAALRRTVERQGVRPSDAKDRDVLALARAGDQAVVHRLAFRGGFPSESRSHLFRSELPDDELWHGVLTALYGGGRRAPPGEVVVPELPADAELLRHVLGGELELVVPVAGERRRMLELAGENARAALARRVREEAFEDAALAALAKLLDLDEPPETIDCFDVSNLQGAHVVASRVRFRHGRPDKAGYRRFKVQSLEGQDDFAAMREVVGRALRRGVAEFELPDLVVIDGGAQQLASALAAREEAGAWDVPIVALAKARPERRARGSRRGGAGARRGDGGADRVREARRAASEERLFLPGATAPLALARHTSARHLLERIRDEAHRFAITFHRKERGRIRSQLDSVPGIGDQKRKALLRRFGSVAGIRAASVEDIAAVRGIGRELAARLRQHLEKA